jgi:hypothetical protein
MTDQGTATGTGADGPRYGDLRALVINCRPSDAWPGIYQKVLAAGNQRSEWDAGCRFDFGNPEYR